MSLLCFTIKNWFEWIERNTGVDTNTSATLLSSFIVFGAGLFAAWLNSQFKISKARSKYRKSLHYLFVDFYTSCYTYSRLILQNASLISLQLNDNITLKIPPLSTLDYLAQLDLSDLIDAYIVDKNIELKPKCISIIYESVKKVQTMQTYQDKFIQNVENNFKTYQNEYRKYLQNIVSIHDEIAFHANSNHIAYNPDSLEYNIVRIFNDHKQLAIPNPNSLYNTYNYIVQPLENLVGNNIIAPNILHLQKTIIPCKQAYLNLENLFKMVGEELIYYAKLTRKAATKAQVSISILEDKERILNVYSYSRKIINSTV